jgi:hypothetical protein
MNGLQLYSVEKIARELIQNGPACYRPAYLAPNPFSRFHAAHVEERPSLRPRSRVLRLRLPWLQVELRIQSTTLEVA